jgi:hypothetical protein
MTFGFLKPKGIGTAHQKNRHFSYYPLIVGLFNGNPVETCGPYPRYYMSTYYFNHIITFKSVKSMEILMKSEYLYLINIKCSCYFAKLSIEALNFYKKYMIE